MSARNKVIVVGAGMAGLAAAKELERFGFEVLILEGSEKVGGRVATDIFEGYTLDRGFQVLPSSYKKTARLIDGLGLRFGAFESSANIWDGIKFFSIGNPLFHPIKFLSAIKRSVFSIPDLFKLLRLLVKKDSNLNNSSIDGLLKIGFSKNAIEFFFVPFFSGVFLEQKLLTPINFLIFALQTFFKGKAQLPNGGMGTIPQAILASLKNTNLKLNHKVSKILEDGVLLENGDVLRAEVIIVATDMSTTEKLFEFGTQAAWRAAHTVYFSCDEAPFKEKALYISSVGSSLICNLSIPSNINSGYAPPGKHLISITLKDSVSEIDPKIISLLKEELKTWFGDSVFNWQLLKSYTIRNALPVCIERHSLKWRYTKHVFLAGDWLEIPSIEHAVVSGGLAARNAVQFLNENAEPNLELADIKHKLEELAFKGKLRFQSIPSYRFQKSDGSYFMLKDRDGFHLVSEERGEEVFKKSAATKEEFLELIFSELKIEAK